MKQFSSALLMLTLFVITFNVGCLSSNQNGRLTPPPHFQWLAEVDLLSHSFDREILGQFTLEETDVTSIFYSLPNIDMTYFDLSLTTPEGASLVILHSEDFHTDANGGGIWEQNLTPGTYQLTLTSHQSPGLLSVYWKRQ